MNDLTVESISILGKEVTEGISLITAVKNREEMLRQALPTWLANPEIDEIIIVDWSSDRSLEHLPDEFRDDRIIMVVVKDQPKWILSYAFNLAARVASRNQLLKMDADVKIMPGFFARQKLQPGIFFTGNWMIGRNENETHLNGIAFYYRGDFFKVNGYSEYITTYGWDDSDLFDRLTASGLNKIDINPDTLYHIPHENRVTHQTGTDFLKNIDDGERSSINILMNRYIATNYMKWGPECDLSEFSLEKKSERTVVCQLSKSAESRIPDDIMEKSEIIAIRERMEQMSIVFHKDWIELLNKNDLMALYRLYLLSKPDPTLANDAHRLMVKLMGIKPVDLEQENAEILRLTEKISELENILIQKEEYIIKLEREFENTLIQKEDYITKLEREFENVLTQKEESINQLKSELRTVQDELSLIKNSKTYRYGSKIARLIFKILPSGLFKR